jgi:tetratricopeptide (TPR) repeat protein
MNLETLINELKKDMPSEILGVKVNPEALAYIMVGDKAFEEANYSQAIIYFTKAIELNSTNRYPLTKRGNCYLMIQAYDEALIDLFKSKELEDNWENDHSIALCYLFKKEFAIAIKYFENTIEKLETAEAIDIGKMTGIDYGATIARELNDLALCYYSLQQPEKGIECTTRGIQLNSNYPDNYFTRGIIYLSQEKNTQARADFTNAAILGYSKANEVLTQMNIEGII